MFMILTGYTAGEYQLFLFSLFWQFFPMQPLQKHVPLCLEQRDKVQTFETKQTLPRCPRCTACRCSNTQEESVCPAAIEEAKWKVLPEVPTHFCLLSARCRTKKVHRCRHTSAPTRWHRYLHSPAATTRRVGVFNACTHAGAATANKMGSYRLWWDYNNATFPDWKGIFSVCVEKVDENFTTWYL